MSNQTAEFIQKAIQIHGDKYDYSQVIYKSRSEKVALVCSAHGTFWQKPHNHLNGDKCPRCRGRFPKGSPERGEYQLSRAKSIHGNKYDYSKINLSEISADTKVEVICPTHGSFFPRWNNHTHVTQPTGCPQCGKAEFVKKTMLGRDEFIIKARKMHGDKYDYDAVNYQGAHVKVDITCRQHGVFECTPANHWHRGVGCPKCLHSNPSRGEAQIAAWLQNRGLIYEYQKSYPDLWYKAKNGRLKYDFYIPSHNLLIEYDGEHHTQPISWSKKIDGVKRLQEQQVKDKLKEDYAFKHGITLLRINFDQDIDSVLIKSIP